MEILNHCKSLFRHAVINTGNLTTVVANLMNKSEREKNSKVVHGLTQFCSGSRMKAAAQSEPLAEGKLDFGRMVPVVVMTGRNQKKRWVVRQCRGTWEVTVVIRLEMVPMQ